MTALEVQEDRQQQGVARQEVTAAPRAGSAGPARSLIEARREGQAALWCGQGGLEKGLLLFVPYCGCRHPELAQKLGFLPQRENDRALEHLNEHPLPIIDH